MIWRLTQQQNRWTKAPFRCADPERHASSKNPNTWTSCEEAVAAAAHGNGISYVLTPDDPFAAVDIDYVRNPITGTVDDWPQRLLDQASRSYAEVSPSGTGLRIWGLATGEVLHRHFTFDDSSALELFRRTNKILTVSSSAPARGSAASMPCSIAP